MPAGGIYLSDTSAQKLSGDLFEQDARGIVADHFEQQATAALPDYVAQAQRDEQQRQQALDAVQQQQRDQAAQQFESSVPDLVSQHLATLAPPESLQNGPSVVTATEPPAAPDLPNAPAVVAADAAVGTSAPSPPVVPSVPAAVPEPASSSPPSPVTVPPVATQPTAQTVTTAGLSGGGDLAGRVGQRGQEIMAAAGDAASWLGEQGQKALQAVLLTEGGLAGARGDKGQSAGPLQFYEGGQLANFARQHGLNFEQAKTYVEQNPEAAVQWAIGTPDSPGYLGATILKGIQQGLSGASLATYAQQHGQVSVSPERAGQNWNALFGDGQNAAMGSIGPGGQQTAAKDPSSILDAVKPFLGDKYAWGGKSPTTGFDCSGLAGYLTTGQAESTGTLYGKSAAVSQDTAQPGDLVFWNMGSSDPHMQHVAVYLGNGQIVQSGGNQASVNIGSVGQSIGSPPEFRRVGQSGGMPAQAALAKQQGVPTDQSAAAAPPEPSLWDKVGSTVQSGLQGLQGIFGGAAANQLPGQGGAPIYNQTAATVPTAAPTDVAQNALPTLQRGLGEFATGTGTIGQASPSTLLSKGMQAVGDTGVAQTVAHTLAPYITTGEVPPDYSHMTGEQLDQQALMVGGMAGPLQMGKIAGAAGHLAQPVESAVADAVGAVKTFPAVANVPASAGPTIEQLMGSLRSAEGTPGISIEPTHFKMWNQDAPEIGQNVVYRDAQGKPAGILEVLLDEHGQPNMLQVAVRPDVQRQGIATQLYAAAKQAGMDVDRATGAGGYTPAGAGLAQSRLAVPAEAAGAARNPFSLPTTPPHPAAVPMHVDEVVQHMGTLEKTYAANDARIEQITSQLDGIRTAAKIDRPSWATGMTDQGVLAVAKHFDMNPYVQGWADSLGPGEMQDVLSYYRGVGTKGLGGSSASGLRQELQQLKSEQQRILDASGQIVDGGESATFYRPQPADASLPWQESIPAGQVAADRGQYPANAPASAAARAVPTTPTPLSLTPVSTSAGAVKPAVAAQVADLQGWLARAAQHPEVSPQVIASKQAQLADLLKPPELPTGGYSSYPAPPEPMAPKPQAATDMLTGLVNMAKDRGMDTSAFEARVAEMTPKEVPPARPVELPPQVPPPPPPGTFSDEIGAVPPSVPTGGAQPWDYLRALRVGSLAGGVQTMSHILLNAPIQTAFKLMSDLPLSVVHPDTIPLEFMGAWQGLRGWASKAAAAPLGQPAKIAQTIGGTTGQVVETGLLGLVKTHPVIQDMARQIGSGMELWRLAGTEATNAGLQRFSAPWWTEVQNMVANPTAEMAVAAQRTGNTFSLGGPMGQTGEAFAKLKGDSKAVDFIMPFFQIGYHVASQGIERSPVGLIGTGIDAARGVLGRGPYAAGAVAEGVTPLAQRFRNNIVGTGLAVEAFHQAAQGNITGNGPDDPKLKADLTATGWQPDSIRIAGRYFPLHVLGPMGWPLAEAANLYEATHTNQDDGGYAKPKADMQAQFGNYVSRMAQYGTNETFLSSIGKVLQAAANTAQGSRMADSEIASILGSLIPQGALFANAAASVDPYNRKPASGDIGQSIQNRIPGLRQDLPLRLTPTGQPEPNAQQGLGILLPRSSLVNPDPVITAMGQAGIGAPTVPKTVSVTSKYQMDLTPQEQEQMQELHGKAFNDQLKDAVADPDWKSLPIEKQRTYIQKANANATDIARKQLLDQIPDADLERRLVLKMDAAAGNRVTVLGGVP